MDRCINLEDKGVSVIVSTNKYDLADNIFNNYVRQNFMKKELIILIHDDCDDFDKWIYKCEEYPMTRVYQQDGSKSIDECLKYCMEQSIFDYITIFEENNHYDSDYLSRLISEFEKRNDNVHSQLIKNSFSN